MDILEIIFNKVIKFLPEITTAFISIGISLILFFKKSRRERDFFIKSQLDNILNVSIQFPYLEDEDFLKEWDNKTKFDKDKVIRYEIYATMIFNYLERLFILFKGNVTEIEKFIDVKSWVKSHQKYWKDPNLSSENYSGYNIEFQKFINKYINNKS